MKTSSAGKGLSRAKARNSVLINQLGTPGLGSIMAGRYVAGFGQLVLFLTGFCLFVGWFVLRMIHVYHQMNEDAAPPFSFGWMAVAGAGLAAASWLWALVTSLSLMREARENEAKSISAGESES